MESKNISSPKQRTPLWDNAKGILIFLVVAGHFLMYIQGNINAQRMLIMIYSFHMPAFVFISGLLSKRAISDRDHKKALYFIAIFLIIKACLILSRLITGHFESGMLNLLIMDDVSWYAFALAVFYPLSMIVAERNAKIVIAIAIAAACLAGYCGSIGTFLSISRLIVFFPVFYIGSCVDKNTMLRIHDDRRIKGLSLALFALCAVFIFFNIRTIWGLLGLLQGKYPYSVFLGSSTWAGAVYRGGWYVLIALLIPAFIALVPKRTLPLLTRAGRNSLSIYVFHNPLIFVIMHTGLREIVTTNGLSFMISSLVLTIVLSFVPLKITKPADKRTDRDIRRA